MQTTFATLPPLARAAVPLHSTAYSEDLVLWHEHLSGGAHWSGVLRRGNTLRLIDMEGRANVAALFFNLEERNERYNMPDTLKAQHTAYLTKGHALYSDMGRVLCSIPEDSCGWHDTYSGVSTAAGVQAQYGEARYQQHRNAMFRNGQDSLEVELNKWGLGRRDMGANVNFFSKVRSDASGTLTFDASQRGAGQFVDVRCEMNLLVVLATAPHPLDPSTVYQPGAVQMTVWRSGTAGADDVCRLHCPENDRGFINTERWFL